MLNLRHTIRLAGCPDQGKDASEWGRLVDRRPEPVAGSLVQQPRPDLDLQAAAFLADAYGRLGGRPGRASPRCVNHGIGPLAEASGPFTAPYGIVTELP